MDFPTPQKAQGRGYILTGFIDPGGSIDDYFFTVLKTDIKTSKIRVFGAMHWLLDEDRGIDFAVIRNQIAKLHLRNYFNMIGCETNNYGRGEIQSMRREYKINMYPVTTSGKITSEKIIKKAHTMDKNQMIKWANSWRVDGNIVFPTPDKITPEIKKIITQLDSFIVKKTNTTAGPQWKYEADGQEHDDGVMSLLGNLYIVKEKFLKINGYDQRKLGAKTAETESIESSERENTNTPGRTMGSLNGNSMYDSILTRNF